MIDIKKRGDRGYNNSTTIIMVITCCWYVSGGMNAPGKNESRTANKIRSKKAIIKIMAFISRNLTNQFPFTLSPS